MAKAIIPDSNLLFSKAHTVDDYINFDGKNKTSVHTYMYLFVKGKHYTLGIILNALHIFNHSQHVILVTNL